MSRIISARDLEWTRLDPVPESLHSNPKSWLSLNCSFLMCASLRASSLFGSHARFMLGEIGEIRFILGASRERIGAEAI